jgi:hypothetical protein
MVSIRHITWFFGIPLWWSNQLEIGKTLVFGTPGGTWVYPLYKKVKK